MQIAVIQSLSCLANATVDLPEGRTWADVRDWFVKWDTLYLTFKDGETDEIELYSDSMDKIDWKRPITTEVMPVDEDGFIDFSKEPLAATG